MQYERVDRFVEEKDSTTQEEIFRNGLERYFSESIGSNYEKICNFAKYAPRQTITRFITRYEIFKKILPVQGSIVECGVLFGQGLMSFAQFSAIFEPVNYQRKIIGFDSFEGFSKIHKEDKTGAAAFLHEGGLAVDSYGDIKKGVELCYDANRFLNHIPKVELMRGDAVKTISKYLKEHPHTVVSLLYLDFDLYEPTKVALEQFLPRIPKGGVVVFDELNSNNWPGETVAILDTVGISNLRIERFPFDSFVSYAVIE